MPAPRGTLILPQGYQGPPCGPRCVLRPWEQPGPGDLLVSAWGGRVCESPAQLPPGAHPGTRLLAPFVSVCGEGAPGPGGQGHSPRDPGPHRVLLRGAPMCSLGAPPGCTSWMLTDVHFLKGPRCFKSERRERRRLTEDRRVAQTGHSAGWDGGHTGAQTHRMEGRVHSHGQDAGPKPGWCDMASGGASAGQR